MLQQVATLTSENGQLVQQVSNLNQQISTLQTQVSNLQMQVTTLTSENADLVQQNSDLQDQLDLLNNVVISGPITQLENQLGITIPGATPAEQLTDLLSVIQGLNPGRLRGIIDAYQ